MRPNDSWRILAVVGLALPTSRLSSRFYTSAAFEHPIILTIITLLIASVLFHHRPSWIDPRHRGQPLTMLRQDTRATYLAVLAKRTGGLFGSVLDTAQKVEPRFRSLVACLVARTLLFWYTLRYAQCSIRGVEALLPLILPAADCLVSPAERQLPDAKRSPTETGPWPRQGSYSIVGDGLLALLWAVCIIFALDASTISTGAVCPIGWHPQRLVPYLQMILCCVDALVIAQLSVIRRLETEDGCDASAFIGTVFLTSAASICFISFIPILIEVRTVYLLRVNYVDVRDLAVDSCSATVVALCGFYLLDSLQPWTVGFIVVGLGLVGSQIPSLGLDYLPAPLTKDRLFGTSSALSVITGALVYRIRGLDHSARTSSSIPVQAWIKLAYMTLVCVCVIVAILWPPRLPETSLPASVKKLFQVSELHASRWEQDAMKSRTLADAVAEYKKRYGIAPPPNFDKWYEFARTRNSRVIDTFDQIHNDLFPFWGIEPSEIRSRAEHLLEFPGLGLGGLRIRNGAVEQSPDIPGTHRWMADAMDRMIQPFSRHLPDMDLVFNLGDECCVALPFAHKESLLKTARDSRDNMAEKYSQRSRPSGTWSGKPAWPDGWAPVREDPAAISPYFNSNLRKQLYYEWIAPTCPPDALGLRSRWWDRSTACVSCAEPHSILTDEGFIVDHAPTSNSLCYQPDLAYLDGFILSPTVASTKMLFPIFSQSRVDGFSDILFPSPWNFNLKSEYEESEDLKWDDKTNALFWRGSSSDGYAWDGTWMGFARARLVNEAYAQSAISSSGHTLVVNASFAGDISKCHAADCRMELDTFTRWSRVTKPPGQSLGPANSALPPPIPFDEHWHYRHLMDMDGAGFSGRFLPFLQSRSLVYRAALFKTWADERLRGWQHYVPVDVRLGQGFWSLVRYLADDGRQDSSKSSGEDIAQQIAQRGRDWASRALRSEDMQIYMFRLLLEWGRVVDDDRENLGYDES